MPFLVYWDGDGERVVFELGEAELVIGRHPSCQVVIDTPATSRQHARLYKSRNRWVVQDLKSTHGTKVNGEAVGRSVLKTGDQILVGETAINFMDRVRETAKAEEMSQVTHKTTLAESPFMRSLERARALDLAAHAGEDDEDPQDEPTQDLPSAFFFDEDEPEDSLAAAPRAEATRRMTPGNEFDPAAELQEQDPDEAGRLLALLRVNDELRRCSTIDELCRKAVELALSSTLADRGRIALQAPGASTPEPRFETSKKSHAVPMDATLRVSTTFIEQVLRERVALVAVEARKNPMLSRAKSVVVEGIRSILCTPLWDGEDRLGYLYLDTQRSGHAFSKADLDLVAAIGYQVATEIGRLQRLRSVRGADAPSEPWRTSVAAVLALDAGDALGDASPGLRRALDAWLDTLGAEARQRGGRVVRALGHEVVAVFGLGGSRPEEAARQAVATAQAFDQAVQRLGDHVPELASCRPRMGVDLGALSAGHTGTGADATWNALGPALSTALRMKQASAPGRTLLTDAAKEAVGDSVRTEFARLQTLRPGEDPVHSWWVSAGRGPTTDADDPPW